jgi:hypothetical protein
MPSTPSFYQGKKNQLEESAEIAKKSGVANRLVGVRTNQRAPLA